MISNDMLYEQRIRKIEIRQSISDIAAGAGAGAGATIFLRSL